MWFWEYRMDGQQEMLNKIKSKGPKDYRNTHIQVSDSMKTYAFSMLQCAQWLINNKKTSAEKIMN